MEYTYPVDHGNDLVADLLSQFNNGIPGGNPQVPDGQPQPTQAPRETQLETQTETFQHAQLDTAQNIQLTSSHAQPGGAEGPQSESLQPEQPEGQLQSALQLSATSEQAHQPEARLAAVKVPRVENREEYEYLPSHSKVRYIVSEQWDNEGDATYTARLRSGELQTVRLRL